MGGCLGSLRKKTKIAPWRKYRTIVLCFVGIDGAGKTTIVKALQGEDLGKVHPTVGFSRAEIAVKNKRVTVYDLGGGERIREIWETYYAEIYGLVYVVDSAASSRMEENKEIIDSLVEVPELTGKPILFLLNKKDLPDALDEIQFSDRFSLHQMAKKNRADIRVEGVCGIKGTGKGGVDCLIVEGVTWLTEKILNNYESIQIGVEEALKRLRERQIQERLERQHRMAAIAAMTSEEENKEDANCVIHSHENISEENGDLMKGDNKQLFDETKLVNEGFVEGPMDLESSNYEKAYENEKNMRVEKT